MPRPRGPIQADCKTTIRLVGRIERAMWGVARRHKAGGLKFRGGLAASKEAAIEAVLADFLSRPVGEQDTILRRGAALASGAEPLAPLAVSH